MTARARFFTVVGAAILLAGIGYLWIERSFAHILAWAPPAPGTVMAQDSSPSKDLLAEVISAESAGVYRLQILSLPAHDVLASRRISAPVGYHPQIVSLKWNQGQVIATIDHDFGDGNLEFSLAPPAHLQ
jgi:hypothetical protein